MSSDEGIKQKSPVFVPMFVMEKLIIMSKDYIWQPSGLYDAAIIYAWNIFMLFVYEKVWQLREVEREAEFKQI